MELSSAVDFAAFDVSDGLDVRSVCCEVLSVVVGLGGFLLDGRSQNTVPIASTQVAIKGVVQYSTKSVSHYSSASQSSSSTSVRAA